MLIWQQSYHLLVAVCRKATLCWCLSGRYHKSTLWWSHNVASQTTPGWGCWSLKTGTCNCVYCHHQRDKEYYTVDENHTTLRRMRWPLKSCARKSPNGLSDLCKLPHFHLPYFMARVVVTSMTFGRHLWCECLYIGIESPFGFLIPFKIICLPHWLCLVDMLWVCTFVWTSLPVSLAIGFMQITFFSQSWLVVRSRKGVQFVTGLWERGSRGPWTPFVSDSLSNQQWNVRPVT